ncbi:regulatory helix-turn-helix LysR family protein [Krasilnikovia cinnamomea]|uniref:Regulatory helix-turn-helix LysR family protein n=1 Tax=Krasilnikovia cinnamomea TaxID=349313 RepID=A0A4Q7ZL94_9ACTN|nr:LysR family transcriptional regulator [Krasilnikovia cinnamomea]RZU51354.1 regulatory helix-turn-helix LysR family protein [Krasilnikovia cinnamomea]
MHERELRAFVATVEAGRMDRAAKALGYSQPAISYQINCLEQELGTRLFVRHPDGAQLTREGAMVLPAARAVLSLVDGIRDAAAQQSRTPVRKLRAAC